MTEHTARRPNFIIRIFSFIWKLIERLVKGIQVLIFLFVLLLFVSLFSGMSGRGITIPESTALIVAPLGFLVEQAEGEPLDRALLEMQEGESQTVTREVVESLERAANDDRIKVAVLLTDYLQGGGLSKHQEVAAALDKFRASGKQVIAMGDSFNQSQYYLASHADEIYMHDFGFVLIQGFGYYKAYFADALEKLKVDVNVFRVGEFKSFVEPYLRNDMSEEDRLASEGWLRGLWAIWKRDVAAARGLDVADLDAYIDNLIPELRAADGDAALAAVNSGLVDGLMDHQEFRNFMIAKVGVSAEEPDTFEQINHRTYLAATEYEEIPEEELKSNVAVIVASGEIIDGEASPGIIGSDTMTRLIRQATNDESVAAVVLRVDSPGGSMFASELILDQLEEYKQSGRPLVASMSSTAASGGYYISMVADEIWAAESTISGSIGVGAMFPTFQRSLGALGVAIDGIGTTPLAGQLQPTRELNDQARQLLDVSVHSAYDVFTDKVAEARGIDPSRMDDLAQGRVWAGNDAYRLGLVDELGDVNGAIRSAAAMAGLAEGEYDTVYIERELSFGEQLLLQYARMLGLLFAMFDISTDSSIPEQLKTLFGDVDIARQLNLLNRWNDPRGIYFHCLCELR
ncbi:MAG: signal peptide peptidase SppA [Gammaproteobacteria bacterium]